MTRKIQQFRLQGTFNFYRKSETYLNIKKAILKKHEDKLHQLANKLLESEVIFKEDLETIFGKRPFEKEVIEEKVKTTTKTTKKVATTKKTSSKKSA